MRSLYLGASALLAVACVGCAARESSADPPRGDGTSAVGTNLAPFSDWSTELASVDLFKAARPWLSGTEEQFEDGRALDLDEHGWVRSLRPGQVARTLMVSNGARTPRGTYVVLYEGRGVVEYQYSGHTDRVEHDDSGRQELEIDSEQAGITISITRTDPANYLRNFRVLMPGGVCESDGNRWCDVGHPCDEGSCSSFEANHAQQIFNPVFLDSLRSYSVLRFMDWMHTNDTKQQQWNDRPVQSDATWSRRGVPVEVMVELANRTQHDPWFCMPHTADDAYVQQFASYVRDNLDPDRKAYVEYSNEVWNGLFPQADHAREQGVAAGLGRSDFEAQMHFYARRATEVHKLWEQVFAGEGERMVRVTASQAGNAWVSANVLDFEDTRAHTDALAIAPYFGSNLGNPEELSRIEHMTLDQLMTELRTRQVPQAVASVKAHAGVAAARKLELIAYEGGQHLAGVNAGEDSESLNRLFDAANRDPRMKAIYETYLSGWRGNGGHVFVHFTSCAVPTKYGRWGAREWLQQPRGDAPKLDALLDFVERNPRWW